MGDGVFIPGFNDKYNSSEAIDKIMEAKRVKLKGMEEENEDIKEKKVLWNEIKSKSINLETNAKKLYGFDSPFDKKISMSTDESAFSANVEKNVEIGEYKINIINKAKAHKIASKSLDKKYNVPQGEYNFQIGDRKVRISFNGGTLSQFAEEIKRDSKEALKASVTFDTSKTQVLILEAGNTGKKNIISFSDNKTKKVFKNMGFFENVAAYNKPFKFDKNNLINLSEVKRAPAFLDNEIFVVDRMEKYRYNLTEKIPYKNRLVMEIDLRLDELDPDRDYDYIEPTGPDYKKIGNVELFNIYLEGESSYSNIPPYKRPEKPEIVIDDHYLEVITNKRTIKFEELQVTNFKRTLKFNMNEMMERDEVIEAVLLSNNNTYKKLEVSSLRFFDEGSMDGVRFTREISKPEDANIILDGIEITRDTNTINDLIKGMTLYVFDETNKEELLKVDRDYEAMVTTITDFLGGFNELLEIVNKETNVNYDEEGEAGEFAGEYGLISLTSKLRTIMMNSYETAMGDEVSLLAQIGISTNAAGFGKMDSTKLKGILEVEENKFIETMEKYPIGVKELFGKDADGDYIVDSGAAYEIVRLLNAYNSKSQGYFDSRTAYYDRQIKDNSKEIKSYEVKLEEEEKKLREKFFKMEKAASELEENRKKFDNMYNQK